MGFVNEDNSATMIRAGEPTMKIMVKGHEITIQDGDEISVEMTPCESCGEHTLVRVYRALMDFSGKRMECVVFERES